MFTYIQRKLLNVLLFFDLISLEKHTIPNEKKETRVQNRRIRKLMKKAYKIPFYRKRFEAIGLHPSDFQCADDLYKFPPLSKQELRIWMEKECHKKKYKYYYLDTTSGSSGTPTKILYSPKEKAYNMANWMRVLIKSGYDPYHGKTMSRMSKHGASAQQRNFLERFGLLRRKFVDQYGPEQDVIDSINEYEPHLLYMNKTELVRIALYSKQHDYPIHHPSLFAATGEKVDNASRKLFQEVLGPNLLDAYGSAETGSCMAKFPGYDNYLIHNDLFVVNLCNENYQPSQHGQLLITPLYKTDIPLINYAIGDKASSNTIDGKKVITEIDGRMNDFIQHENGQVTTFFMIAPIFAHCEEIVQFRLIQKSYTALTIQGVRNNTTSKPLDLIEKELYQQLEESLQQPMDITFEWVNVIEPDPNGKLRLIVNAQQHT